MCVLHKELEIEVAKLRKQMRAAANKLEFERAADLRDLIRELETFGVEQLGVAP